MAQRKRPKLMSEDDALDYNLFKLEQKLLETVRYCGQYFLGEEAIRDLALYHLDKDKAYLELPEDFYPTPRWISLFRKKYKCKLNPGRNGTSIHNFRNLPPLHKVSKLLTHSPVVRTADVTVVITDGTKRYEAPAFLTPVNFQELKNMWIKRPRRIQNEDKEIQQDLETSLDFIKTIEENPVTSEPDLVTSEPDPVTFEPDPVEEILPPEDADLATWLSDELGSASYVDVLCERYASEKEMLLGWDDIFSQKLPFVINNNQQEFTENVQELPSNSQDSEDIEILMEVSELPNNVQKLPKNIPELPENVQELPKNVPELPKNVQKDPTESQDSEDIEILMEVTVPPKKIQELPEILDFILESDKNLSIPVLPSSSSHNDYESEIQSIIEELKKVEEET